MRKRYTAQFKAGIVQEILKEERTIGQIASEQGIHPNQLNRWKAIALEGLPSLFSKDGKAAEVVANEYCVNKVFACHCEASAPKQSRLAKREIASAALAMTHATTLFTMY